jgi:hypothetical protein
MRKAHGQDCTDRAYPLFSPAMFSEDNELLPNPFNYGNYFLRPDHLATEDSWLPTRSTHIADKSSASFKQATLPNTLTARH